MSSLDVPEAKPGKKWLAIGVIAGVLVISVVGILLLRGSGPGQVTTSSGYTIYPHGNVTVVQPNTAHGIEFLISTNGTISGSFKEIGNVTVYILSEEEWNYFPMYHNGVASCPLACPPYFILKNANSGTISAQLSPGRYWLAFDNNSPTQQASITITESVVATGGGYVCQTSNC